MSRRQARVVWDCWCRWGVQSVTHATSILSDSPKSHAPKLPAATSSPPSLALASSAPTPVLSSSAQGLPNGVFSPCSTVPYSGSTVANRVTLSQEDGLVKIVKVCFTRSPMGADGCPCRR